MGKDDEIQIQEVGKGDEIGVQLPNWLAEKKRIPNGVLEGTVEATTGKAVLIGDDWVPKSQVEKAWLL